MDVYIVVLKDTVHAYWNVVLDFMRLLCALVIAPAFLHVIIDQTPAVLKSGV